MYSYGENMIDIQYLNNKDSKINHKDSKRNHRKRLGIKSKKVVDLVKRLLETENITLDLTHKEPKQKSLKELKSEIKNNFQTKWKTEICHYWEMNAYCKYGENCAFAHGPQDMRNKKHSQSYRSLPCIQFFEKCFCSYGSRCQFSHKM